MSGDPQEVNRFVDLAYGKEADASHGAAARYIARWVKVRPAAGKGARWPDFEAMFAHARFMDSTVTEDQLNAAIAAFRAVVIE